MHSSPVIDALHHRVSVGDLVEPAPDAAQRELLFRAALRAPDHGQLRPWRFLLVEGEARARVGQILADVEDACYGPQPEAGRNKTRQRLLRAPLVVLIVAHVTPHAKVPELEQLLSTACAVQNVLLAADALGFAGMWRTGPVTFEPLLAERLGLAQQERLLGFLYLGTPRAGRRQPPVLAVDDFVAAWREP